MPGQGRSLAHRQVVRWRPAGRIRVRTEEGENSLGKLVREISDRRYRRGQPATWA